MGAATWRTVPVEPTEAMLVNGREALMPLVRLDSYGPLIGIWKDMLAASPVVSVGREEITAILESYIGASAWSDDADAEVHGIPEAADAILAALRPTDTGWRDITTAPRDGADVLACDDGTGEHYVSYWTGHCWSGQNRFKPTHWIPLPPAPTDTGRE